MEIIGVTYVVAMAIESKATRLRTMDCISFLNGVSRIYISLLNLPSIWARGVDSKKDMGALRTLSINCVWNFFAADVMDIVKTMAIMIRNNTEKQQ